MFTAESRLSSHRHTSYLLKIALVLVKLFKSPYLGNQNQNFGAERPNPSV